MKHLENFLALFSAQEKTAVLEQFAQQYFTENIWIANGLELTHQRKEDLEYFLLEEEKRQQYENQFLIFGQATHSGSSYAFYKTSTAKNWEEWPILVLGDEGGAVILAKNIFDLFRFWTLNSVQPYVNSADYQSFDLMVEEDFEEDNQAFQDWIQTTFGLAPLATIEEARTTIIQPAKALYQQAINTIFG